MAPNTATKEAPKTDGDSKSIRFEVPDDLKKKWASTNDAMQELKVSRATIEKWRKDGRLKWKLYYGNNVLICRESMKAMLKPFM
jgi:hypothetical protein